MTGRLSAMESSTGTLGTLKEGRERSSKEGMDVSEVSAMDECAYGISNGQPCSRCLSKTITICVEISKKLI